MFPCFGFKLDLFEGTSVISSCNIAMVGNYHDNKWSSYRFRINPIFLELFPQFLFSRYTKI